MVGGGGGGRLVGVGVGWMRGVWILGDVTVDKGAMACAALVGVEALRSASKRGGGTKPSAPTVHRTSTAYPHVPASSVCFLPRRISLMNRSPS